VGGWGNKGEEEDEASRSFKLACLLVVKRQSRPKQETKIKPHKK
jgi:hypothetical protein